MLGSGSPIVTMMQPSPSLMRHDASCGWGPPSTVGCSLPQSQMRAVRVIVANIFSEQTLEVSFIHRHKLIP